MRRGLAFLLAAVCGPLFAAEGMWTLDNLPLAQMKARYGFTPSAAFVDKAMHASVRLSVGCSGSFISPQGLVMTNHHCAAECAEQLSSPQKDYLKDGFIAHRREDEPRCPALEVVQLEQITDVTERVKQALAGLDGQAFQAAEDRMRATLTQQCVGNAAATVRCDLVTLYQGGVYNLYRYHRYSDVRLVWAPEDAIAAFGGDPDNFNFPRYDLDVSYVRVYENGKPAAVRDHFAFNTAGAQVGEMTFITGHPGTTQRQFTVAQLEAVRDNLAEVAVPRTSEYRGILLQYVKGGAEQARMAGNALDGTENSLKVRRGQLQALNAPSLMEGMRADERALKAYVAANAALAQRVGDPWSAIEKAQAARRDLDPMYSMLEVGRGFFSDYFSQARTLVRAAAERPKPNAERLREFADSRLPELEQRVASPAPIYPPFENVTLSWSLSKLREVLGPDDAVVKQVLGVDSPDAVAARLIAGTKLGDPAERLRLWKGGQAAIVASDDPFIKLALQLDPAAREIRGRFETDVSSVERKNAERIAIARFERTGKSAYPDATFTLRLSYGEVRGFTARGKPVAPFTDIEGAFSRATGADPFALPPSWLDAKGRVDLKTKFNFVTTNDIIGGNSGSPVLNRDGQIVGLVFDGNIDSLGGAYGYDEKVNRSVSVHAAAIVEALRKVYDGGDLIREMGLAPD